MGLLGPGPDLMAEIGLDARGFIVGTRQVGTSLSVLGKHPLLTGAAIATAIGAIGVTAAMRFEDALVGVAKTMDLTNEEAEAMGRTLVEMSRVKPFSAVDIAGVARIGGQLGIAKESLADFTNVMLDFGSAAEGIMTAEDAADAFARFSAAAGVPQDQFDRMASTVVHLGNNLATTEDEIIKMAFRIAGTGRLVGLSTDQILGFSAALSSLGIRAELGGSAISRIMKEMHVAVNDTSVQGRAKLESMARVAGTTAENFARVWREDPKTALIQFLTGLTEMEQAGENLIPILNEMGFSNIRVSDVLLRAKNGYETVRKAVDIASEGWRENIALTQEAERRYATTSSQLKLLANDIVATSVQYGTKFLPSVNNAIRGLRDFIRTGGGAMRPVFEAFGRLKNEVVESIGTVLHHLGRAFGESGVGTFLIRTVALAIDGLTLAFSLLSTPVELVAKIFGDIGEWMNRHEGSWGTLAWLVGGLTLAFAANSAGAIVNATSLGTLTAAMWLYDAATGAAVATTSALAFLLSPLTIAIVGLTSTVGAAYTLHKEFGGVLDNVNSLLRTMGLLLETARFWTVQAASAVGGAFITALYSAASAVNGVSGTINVAWQGAVSGVTSSASGLVGVLGVMWGRMGEDADSGHLYLRSGFDTSFETLSRITTEGTDILRATFSSFLTSVRGNFDHETSAIRTTWNAWADAVVAIGASIWERVRAPFENIVSTIRDFGGHAFGNMREGFEAGWESVTAWFGTLAQNVGDFFGGLPAIFVGIGRALIEKIRDGALGAWGSFVSAVGGLRDGIGDFFGVLPSRFLSIGNDILTRLRDGLAVAWQNVASWVSGRASDLLAWFAVLPGSFVRVGGEIVAGLRTGITNGWQAFKDFVSTRIEAVIRWARDILGVSSPSKVFAELGHNVLEGFEKGVGPLGEFLKGGRIDTNVTMNGTRGGSMATRGGVTIGTLVVHASGRREGDEAGRALERRLMRLGVTG